MKRFLRRATKHVLVSENIDKTEPKYRNGATAKLRVTIDGKSVRALKDYGDNAIEVWFHGEKKSFVYRGITKNEVYNMAGLYTTTQVADAMCDAVFGKGWR